MRKLNGFDLNLVVSLILFVLCLTFTGYYTGETRNPVHALNLLAMGWLGVFFDGQLSWLANPLFLIALIAYRKPYLSLSLAALALALSLSFLSVETVLRGSGSVRDPITGYGWGYFLWVQSLTIFFIGRIFNIIRIYKTKSDDKEKIYLTLHNVVYLLALSLASFYFIPHYYINDNSPYLIKKNRSIIFNEKCKIATQKIYKEPTNVRSIYFNPNSGARYEKITNGYYSGSGGGVLADGKLRSGLIEFYEGNNYKYNKTDNIEQKKYKRYTLVNNIIKNIEVDELQSEYGVISTSITNDISDEFGIYGSEINIIDLRTNEKVATTTYVVNRMTKQFCGFAPKGYFSVSLFVLKTLKLTKQHPSVYK